MSKSKSTTVESTESTSTKVTHSPCTLAVAKCRLAAIAAIAEPMLMVARAYVQQAELELTNAIESAADDIKDAKQVNTARRWVAAATTAAESEDR